MEKLTGKCKSFLTGSIRKAWRFYSEARRQTLKSRTCANCKQVKREIFADHKDPVGSFIPANNEYISRMFCDASNLQPLCKVCHDEKTARERALRKSKKKKAA